MKWVNIFLNHVNLLEETLKLIYLNMQNKSDFKNATWVDASKLAAKSDLDSLKAEIDKIDIDKLKAVPVDLITWSNVVNNDVVKKNAYDKLQK